MNKNVIITNRDAPPAGNFAKKKSVEIPPSILTQVATMVPSIYFWVEEYNGKPTIMTAAVRWEKMDFGLSFPVDENSVRMSMDRTKLINHMKEVVSILVLHGKRILDGFGQIDPKLVNEQEALRWGLDPLWFERVAAVGKLTKVKEITKDEAVRLKFL